MFQHRFGFESGEDGGVVEVSTDGGATWSLPDAARRPGGGPTTTLATGNANPLGGMRAFTGTSDGQRPCGA